MAKKSMIERNKKRMRLVARDRIRRDALKSISVDPSFSPEERFAARMKLAKMTRNGSPVRVRLRCELTGRSRGNYRKFGLSRIALRELASAGRIPGVVKSSW